MKEVSHEFVERSKFKQLEILINSKNAGSYWTSHKEKKHWPWSRVIGLMIFQYWSDLGYEQIQHVNMGVSGLSGGNKDLTEKQKF